MDSPAGFVAQLRLLKAWAGNPSYERLARTSGVPRSTLADALRRRGDRLPALDVVRRFVRACGVAGGDVLAWEEQWRQLQATMALAGTGADADPVEATADPGRPVPRQLPADVSGFAGRDGVVSALDATLRDGGVPGPVVISAVSGTAGVGKTALAVHWAHQVADRFPDGQLYVNLRGFHPGAPMSPIEALGHFLYALGTPHEQIPVEQEQATGLYRSLLADRRMLVLLDNAASADQVRPLLPGSPGSLVLVTSRDQLSGLVARDGAHRLTLGRLPGPEALDLLRGLLGERIDAEPDAAAALVDRCVGLPLALRIAAAHLIDHPDQRLATYLDQLDTGDRLAALQIDGDPQMAVRAAFDLSYHRLGPDSRRLFRLLGLVPVRDLTAEAAAALAGTDARTAGRLLDRLAAAHLLERHAPHRYTFHDLLRAYAAECARGRDGESERRAAADRLYALYLHRTGTAAAMLYPELVRLPAAPGEQRPPVREFTDSAQALAWLDDELPNLVAAATHTAANGPRPVAWQLSDNLRGYFWLRILSVEWLATARAGLAAAVAEQHLPGQVAGELGLAAFHRRRDQYQLAIPHLTRALELARRAGWLEAQATALSGLGGIHYRLGRLERAASYHGRALTINQRAGSRDGEAGNHHNLGLLCHDLGRLQEGADHAAAAIVIAQERGTRTGQANSLGLLGEFLRTLGRLDEARDHHTRALEMAHETGDRGQEAIAGINLADVECDAGRYQAALALARTAVARARCTSRQIEAAALVSLARIHCRAGRYGPAIGCLRDVLVLADQTGNRYLETDAHAGLAESLRGTGELRDALRHGRRALELAREAGFRVLEGNALTALGAIQLAEHRASEAIGAADAALAIHRDCGHRIGEGRARLLLGHATLHTGDTGSAHRHWRAALDLFDGIGAAEAGEVRALLVP